MDFSQWLQHEARPLVLKGQRGHFIHSAHGLADGRPERRHGRRQLHGDGGDELARAGEVAAAAREEETSAEPPRGGAPARNCARNGRLARASQAAEPKDVALVVRLSPRHDLVQQRHARAFVARRFVRARGGVELGTASVGQRPEQDSIIVAADIRVTYFSRDGSVRWYSMR